ncbi:hypothetical protein [Desulfofustis glycolicus]|uniref:Uncharacterized protein n=1 Tax=Desulfofustis glycolicus DSM 9705 TaxID=1121409 RepID=A0A1M5YBM7_9BACT|nr:hypothetical protein [Desulfofustis glycolicus]MCB2217743.1 hypothetical protein [Desulfobulbaceae bacterium]SHI09427.1 hypothetical protein SAMN02745124_03834 [Desulfofustis glycolicus DSM 9705]
MKKKESDQPTSWEEEVWESPPLMARSHIKHDTFLNCWCPQCGVGLNEGDKAVFEIVNQQGQVGISRIAAYLNVLEQESTLQIDDDEELSDVRCPHCHASLIEPGRRCRQDGCKMAAIHVSISNSLRLKLISCTRQSCRWYEMSDEDNERLILRDSHEW